MNPEGKSREELIAIREQLARNAKKKDQLVVLPAKEGTNTVTVTGNDLQPDTAAPVLGNLPPLSFPNRKQRRAQMFGKHSQVKVTKDGKFLKESVWRKGAFGHGGMKRPGITRYADKETGLTPSDLRRKALWLKAESEKAAALKAASPKPRKSRAKTVDADSKSS